MPDQSVPPHGRKRSHLRVAAEMQPFTLSKLDLAQKLFGIQGLEKAARQPMLGHKYGQTHYYYGHNDYSREIS